MRPGAPLSPGLIRRTRCEGAWFTQCGEVSQRSLPGPAERCQRLAAVASPGPCGWVTWGRAAGLPGAVRLGYLGPCGWVTWGRAAGLPGAVRLGYLGPCGWVTWGR